MLGSNSKIIAIIGFICLSFANIIAYLNPSQGYELSFYEQTPLCVWLLIAISVICGLFVIFFHIRNEQKDNFWLLLGLSLLILIRISLLYLPFIRGYYTWNGDNISILDI